MASDYKEVKLGDKTYRVGRMTARNGSWIVMQIVTKVIPFGGDGQLGIGGAPLPPGRKEMTEEEFQNIQLHCLRVCSRLELVGEQLVPQNVLRDDGRMAFPDMEYDVITVLQLSFAALIFNVVPFFSEGVLERMMGSIAGLFQGSLPSSAPK